MRRYLLLVGLLVMLWGTEARAATITFGNLEGDSLGFSIPYQEQTDSFIVHPFGPWSANDFNYISTGPFDVEVSPNPLLFVTLRADNPPVGTDNGELFSFNSIDLFSDTAGTQFIFTGRNDEGATGAGTFSYIVLPGDIGIFKSIQVNSLGLMDQLTITASVPINGTVKLDNFCVKEVEDSSACFSGVDPNGNGNGSGVPEPASLLLLGAGLAGIGIWRRKAAR